MSGGPRHEWQLVTSTVAPGGYLASTWHLVVAEQRQAVARGERARDMRLARACGGYSPRYSPRYIRGGGASCG